ncbi:MAG TPA: hypothetical protein ENJ42_05250 [Hellea balneolensis]|uniref:Pilus assembly protein CpaD n=1 Tax=Hellea balneolensis TaxID=287478 RepID=A0A7C5R0S5_9PROT|nr:hypothetical protein [Hellea balneolensis]
MKYLNGLKLRSISKLALMVTIGASVLSACSTYQPTLGAQSERNKITVAQTIERLELYAPASGLKLSARDSDAVSDFLYQYAQTGQGPLYVNVPANAAQGLGVRQTQSLLNERLRAIGLSGGALQTGQYPSRPGVPAPVVVSYRRLATVPIDCSVGSNLIRTFNNQPQSNFGCFQAANLAAMIDDPRQLLAPHEFDALPAVKRTTTIENYIKGEPTATELPDRQQITVNE